MDKRPSSQRLKRGVNEGGHGSSLDISCDSAKENRNVAASTAAPATRSKLALSSSKKSRLALSPINGDLNSSSSSSPKQRLVVADGEQLPASNNTGAIRKVRPAGCDGEGSGRKNTSPPNSRKQRNNSNKENSCSGGNSPNNCKVAQPSKPFGGQATVLIPRNSSHNGKGVGKKTREEPTPRNNGRSSSDTNWRAKDEGKELQQQQIRATEPRPREQDKKICDFQAALNAKPFVPMAHRQRASFTQPLRSPFSGSDGFATSSPLDPFYNSETGSAPSSANRDRNENIFNFNFSDIQQYAQYDYVDSMSSSMCQLSLEQPWDSSYSSLPLDFSPFIPPPFMALPPQGRSSFPAYVDQQGYISLQLREKVMLDISASMAIRLRNIVQQTTVTMSGCGTQVALVHPKGCVLQYGQRIEIQVNDEISVKNAKMYPRGVSFTANNCALVYLLDQAGTRTTSEMFHDLQVDNVATVLFQQTCDSSAESVNINIARLEEAVYWKSENNVDSWIINGISVQQTRDGLTIVERVIGQHRYMMKASPSNGKVRLETGFMQVTASLGDESHLFVRSIDRRLHYNGKNLVFTVRNAGHAAGFDEGGVLRIF